jgi:hypothetical protein
MSLAATVPFLISFSIQEVIKRSDLVKFSIIFIILALPSLIFFYIPTITSVAGQNAAQAVYGPWPRDSIAAQLKPGLFYAGIICTSLLLLINYRILGWMVGWVLIYFMVVDLSSALGARFARELCVVFGLIVGVAIANFLFMTILGGWKSLGQRPLNLNLACIKSARLILIVLFSGSIITLAYWYFSDYLQGSSNPNTVKYFTSEMDRSNRYFLTSTGNTNDDKAFSNDSISWQARLCNE